MTRRKLFGTAAGLGAGAILATRGAARADAPPPPAAPLPGTPPTPPPAPTAVTTGPAKAARPLKILMLGGTAFLGPEIVGPAVARGHTVTLFNRGKTHAELFPDLEKLRGDRNDDVSALNGRSFDAVIDTSAYVPSHIRRVKEALGDRIGHYTLVSTISVYPTLGETRDPIDENTAIPKFVPAPGVEKATNENYGPMKALCEQAAEESCPAASRTSAPASSSGPVTQPTGSPTGPRASREAARCWPPATGPTRCR